jgi:serine/threonine-protein kinase
VLTVVMDALAGLHAAHTLVGDDGERLNLVHCDVSPENLLVGVDGVCRLTDFGIARLTTEGSVSDRATHGKPGYLAPEQVTGGRVDSRADVFAMGIVLWNALTGQQLFAARTAQEQMRLVLSARISPPSAVGARPTPALDFVCMKALERDPDRRFGSADEMLTELRRIAMREELLAPSGDVAAWVREAFGRELAQRRLTVLDAARRASSPPVAESSEASAEPPRSIPSSNPPSPASAGHELSRTIVLPEVGGRGRRLLILSASAVAAIAILLTLLFPNQVSKLFRASKPAGVVAPPPEAAAPEPAKSAPNLEPIVTPVPHTTLEAREPAPAPEAPPRAVRHPISRPPPATSARQAPDPGASAEEPRAASPTPEPTAAPSAAFPGVEP